MRPICNIRTLFSFAALKPRVATELSPFKLTNASDVHIHDNWFRIKISSARCLIIWSTSRRYDGRLPTLRQRCGGA